MKLPVYVPTKTFSAFGRAKAVLLSCILFAVFFAASCGTSPSSSSGSLASAAAGKGSASDSAVPGSFENAAPSGLSGVIRLREKLDVKDDELAIFYVRPDKNYEPWALWLWALPGGDGNAAWPKTQNWKVQDGIGYMRFKLDGSDLGVKPIGSQGQFGMIARQKGGWTKDGDDDRLWDIALSNSVVIFSGDSNVYAARDYKPKALSAALSSLTEIQLTLSGRYGLDIDGGPSGFSVSSPSGKTWPIARVSNAEFPDDPSRNNARRVVITLAGEATLSEPLIVSNPVFEGSKAVDSSRLAITLAEKTLPSRDQPLGARYDSARKSASFALWAPTSSAAVLNLYAGADSASPDYRVPMAFDSRQGIWTASFSEKDPEGYFYDYTLTNAKGSATVLDPYARSMAAYRNEGGSGRGAVVDMGSKKAQPRGSSPAGFVTLKQREDAVIYEMSVRDFTISPDSAVEQEKGTYLAFIEKIPYLKKLGITHVQLMPVVNFYFTDETDKAYEGSGRVSGNNYNWGYDPHNYFTPEGWYSSRPEDPYSRVAELRTLIEECHKAGIGVLLDVVYNHMANTSFLDDIVPGYYFRTNAQGKLTSNSGCGNDVATERAMARRLIVDSVRHWVSEYKVDGFRFDLMGLMDTVTVLESWEAARAINPNSLFVGEGWKMYNGPVGTAGMEQAYMGKTDSVSVFNDEIRDLFKAGGFNEQGRGFLTRQGPNTEKLYRNILGQPQSNYRADDPGDNLQYLVAHDGLTLRDGIAHNAKLDPADPAQRAELVSRIKLGNFALLTSQGIAFLHGGQERGRTKPNVSKEKNETIGAYVRNSYDSSDDINQIVWTLGEGFEGLPEYTASLVELRKKFDVFRIGDMARVNASAALLPCPEESRLTLGYTLAHGDSVWIVLMNAEAKPMTFDLGSLSAKDAVVYADAAGAHLEGAKKPAGVSAADSTVTVDGLTGAVLRVKK
ncbi:alpha-amylase family glycosyl hydrolase [Teretinema zuelzerae]|uniref:alpha-amylase family glycosyl hydrolase n=1 Tax=Teretinema zuelzerae TaxID=156 RepID=UPI001E649B02|nr:alpha-amylase family glycosyl hydrolase [Teretinema zuelzerae]